LKIEVRDLSQDNSSQTNFATRMMNNEYCIKFILDKNKEFRTSSTGGKKVPGKLN